MTIFDYLLNIDSYNQPLINTKTNRLHTILIADIIKTILKISEKNISSKVAIPLVLNSILSFNIDFYEEIDTHNFNIDNIKITDLYKEADKNNISNIDTHPSWRKVTISNEFLYNKLTTIIKKGTYYFQDNLFVLENIENNTSDFKVSIDEENIISFLKTNLEYLYNKNNKKIV